MKGMNRLMIRWTTEYKFDFMCTIFTGVLDITGFRYFTL